MRRFAFVVLLLCARSVAALDVPLTITNREAVPRAQQPVTGGVPFARGVLADTSRVRLLRGSSEVAAQFLTTASWPDGSVRWLLVDTQVDLPSSGSAALTLKTDQAPQSVSGVSYSDSSGSLTVNTGTRQFSFQKSELRPGGITFEVVSGGTTYRATPDSWVVEESGPMKLLVRVDGSFTPAFASALVRFRARMTFFRNRSDARVALTFQNRTGFNWEGSRPPGLSIDLTEARFGTALVAGGGHIFGPGVEKTWRVALPATGAPVPLESRYAANGSVAAGYSAPDPLLVAAPAYYASTKAGGVIALPPQNGGDMQTDFDRFERIQRAKVIAAEVEDPPNITGMTVWGHLSQDLGSWNDYGDLRWDGNGCGTLSGNHYDWSYGMYLQFMRSGRLEFADAARVFAGHEVDLDVYHTGDDGTAYNFQKNWEDRPSHDTPDNCFGGGRPTHTWVQGYALHWLLTGDRRGLDAFQELQEGIRQYLYESFVDDGHVNTNEIRTQGWIVDNLVALWRINPAATLQTPAGAKQIPRVIRDVLTNVFEREAAAGGRGFVYAGDENSPDVNLVQPLQDAYFVEPLIKAYDEVLRSADPAYAAQVLGLARRITDYLIAITYGGDTNTAGEYRPRQIPYFVDLRQPVDGQMQGQVPYLLMAANAAGFLYGETGVASYRDYARAAFRDYVRYVGAIAGDTYGDPASRTPASYNSVVFTGTESKIHGWSSRFGQYYLASEQNSTPAAGRRRAIRR